MAQYSLNRNFLGNMLLIRDNKSGYLSSCFFFTMTVQKIENLNLKTTVLKLVLKAINFESSFQLINSNKAKDNTKYNVQLIIQKENTRRRFLFFLLENNRFIIVITNQGKYLSLKKIIKVSDVIINKLCFLL